VVLLVIFFETKPATGRGRSPLNRDHIDLAFTVFLGAGLWGIEQIICHLVVFENGQYQFMAILVGTRMMVMMMMMMISLNKTHSANGLKHLET